MADQYDDLEQLLDSAVDDFQTLNLASASQRSGDGDEESRKQKEKEKEKEKGNCLPSLPTGVRGLGMGLPDLKSKKKREKKVSKENHVEEALDKLREQTREAVKGLESVTAASKPDDSTKDAFTDDWVKQFEELAGSQDMESIVETMMQQLLSKEILYEPMKEIGERYPKWLEEHKASLNKEDHERYSHQYELINDLNDVYESDPSNYNKIFDLMQKMQECGQPPNDIVQELAPDIDFANLGQISPEMLEAQGNCCIM